MAVLAVWYPDILSSQYSQCLQYRPPKISYWACVQQWWWDLLFVLLQYSNAVKRKLLLRIIYPRKWRYWGWFLRDPIPSFRFLLFGLKKESVFVCSPKVQSPTGLNLVLRIRWPKSSDFGILGQSLTTRLDDSAHRITKSKNGIGL